VITVEELARHKGIPAEFLQKELHICDTAQGVLIPYYTPEGALASRHRLRTALKAKAGSLWTEGTGDIIAYGANRTGFYGKQYCFLVEGETDCITLWYNGFNALGIPGATMDKTIPAVCIEKFPLLYAIREPDTGGTKFIEGITERLKLIGWPGKLEQIVLPCKDISDFYLAEPETFRDRLVYHLTAIDKLGMGWNKTGEYERTILAYMTQCIPGTDDYSLFDIALHFESPDNQILYNTILKLYHQKLPITIPLIYDNIVGSQWSLDILSDYLSPTLIPSPQMMDAIVKRFLQKIDFHRVQEVAHNLQYDAFVGTGDVPTLVETYKKRLDQAITAVDVTSEALFGGDLSFDPTTCPGIVTKRIFGLDENVSFREGNLVTIMGNTGEGKSSLALNLAYSFADQGYGTLYLSCEMKAMELKARTLAYISRQITVKDILDKGFNSAWLTPDQKNQAMIYDKLIPVITGPQDVSMIPSLWRNNGYPRFVIVDYLQLVTTKQNFTNPTHMIAHIATSLQQFAMNADHPLTVIALSQITENEGIANTKGSRAPHEVSNVLIHLKRPRNAPRMELNFIKVRNGVAGGQIVIGFHGGFNACG